MSSAQDHKRAKDGDQGLNTGGMGTFSPSPFYTEEVNAFCMEHIFKPTMAAMKAEGRDMIPVSIEEIEKLEIAHPFIKDRKSAVVFADYVEATAGTGVTGTAKGDQNAYTITLATDSETYPFELADTAIRTVLGQA